MASAASLTLSPILYDSLNMREQELQVTQTRLMFLTFCMYVEYVRGINWVENGRTWGQAHLLPSPHAFHLPSLAPHLNC